MQIICGMFWFGVPVHAFHRVDFRVIQANCTFKLQRAAIALFHAVLSLSRTYPNCVEQRT
jgi:hypothetical protein